MSHTHVQGRKFYIKYKSIKHTHIKHRNRRYEL